ncbi:hypothetical protein [Meiothermus ruber]|jgi:hypothetical protein|uniref:Uncharacterized protein n=1 Tax=Meiothermus ruber (strain ATCC 35948 / DSM 1279 / VKM B-1258 / 21) TaxID=504728 RepID=D3PKD0_MEIRD|nr:hypothetical protein [Meiothermus ruber]GIW29886.1 MAG: hypothetical protein KatS3mg071_0060 [Meiothermus sp.]ADD26811.1 hypothetical protein Mrub_0030 [Meiothermus ruber DSM 1279]AGK04716.1 hypothetical protein K649_07080 [Meiothermus ruber DSM 1279]MCL6529810.1 hypothetical protein [Meiothermus ruber]MCX7803223.1 hypothetical protein [Meiothermus ruber]
MKKSILIASLTALALSFATAQDVRIDQGDPSAVLVQWVSLLPQEVQLDALSQGQARLLYDALSGLSYAFTPAQAQEVVQAIRQALPQDEVQALERAAAQTASLSDSDKEALVYFSGAQFEDSLRTALAQLSVAVTPDYSGE